MAQALNDCAEKCTDTCVACFRSCFRTYGRSWRHAVCTGGCNTTYFACLSACYGTAAVVAVVDVATDIAQQAYDYVRTHPQLVVGTITMIAVLGPGGAIMLAAA